MKTLLKLFCTFCILLSMTACSTSQKQATSETDVSPLLKHEFALYKNSDVERWIEYFSVKDKERFQRFLTRGHYYKEMIQTTLEEEELPYLLYYQAMIESGFNLKAHSHAGAVGHWQFIKGTARRYDLTVRGAIDERRDPLLSTKAATKYLSDLYNVFNSWELALAAYNCGEIRVLRAIMKGETRDFWELSRKKLLPAETRNYVPKFLAAAYLGENAKKYNLSHSSPQTYPDVDSYTVPGGVLLRDIAKSLNVSEKMVVELNPSLKRKRTPSWLKTYNVWLPPKLDEQLASIIPSLQKNRTRSSAKAPSRYYRVRKGDTLLEIALRHSTSVKKIKRINGIRNSKIFPGQKILVRSNSYKKVEGRRYYFVKQNDTIGSIARRNGLTQTYLRRLNGLSSSKIYIGQKLNITKGVQSFRYKVKAGDNLGKIARLYRTSAKKIIRKNRLKSNRIYVGQVLTI